MVKRIRKCATILVLLFCLTIIFNPLKIAASNGQWKKNSIGWWYQNPDGSYPKSQWKQINGKWYYFDSKGYMQIGWQQISGKWYYLGSSGAMQTGWQKIGGSWYYLDSSGVMKTGWLKLGNKWYYLSSFGVMQTGWKEIGGKWYYFDSSGVMKTGWLKLGDKWYYLDSSGVMQTGLKEIKGKKYVFKLTGEMYTGWIYINGQLHYMNPTGEMAIGWTKINDNWYYMYSSGGYARDTWINGKYYVGSDGVMYVNSWTPDGYFVGPDGAWIPEIKDKSQTAGWYKDEYGYRYMDVDGNFVENGWKKIDGKWYYFDYWGYRLTGYLYIDDDYYYFDDQGVMQTGWVLIDSDYCYFDSSGKQVKDGWKKIDGNWYYFDYWGYMQTGYSYIDGDHYYFDDQGVMQTGWVFIDDEYYYFDSTGKMGTDQWIGDYYLLSDGRMARNQWIGESYVDENGKKDNSLSRTLASNLDIEGFSIGSYEYAYMSIGSGANRKYYTKKYNYSQPDKLHYYIDSAGNINVVAYDHTVDFWGYNGNKKLVINTYNKDMKFLSQKIIDLPYDLWGGFYQGKDGNFYVVCGQENTECSRTKSVIKVLKYNQNWKLIGSTDIYGSTTYIHEGIQKPFHAGNCRMDMKDNLLIIHTSRLLFPDSDGISHQCNISFIIDVNTMKEVKDIPIPYVAHSFNQFIKYDNDNMLYIDHGDAYPRSICATLVKKNGQVKELDLFKFHSGVDHYNYTGATLSGLGIGEKNNIIVGMAKPHDHAIDGITGYDTDLAYNIYQIIIDKDLNKSTFKWITQYNPKETSKLVNEPRLVKISDNRFAVIFSEEDNGIDTLQYRLIDDNGNILASHSYRGIHFPASSDPIIVDNNIVWVAPDKGAHTSKVNYFYKIPILYR